jgi:FkbM family methyltransferase
VRVTDFGANLGAFTLLAASHGCEVVAVEPDPTMYAALQQNVAANPELAPSITTLNVGVASIEGKRWLHSTGTMSGGIMRAKEGATPIEIACRTLPWCLRVRTAMDGAGPCPRYHFVKMDIEGVECEVLGEHYEELVRADAFSMEWHNFDGALFRALLKPLFADILLEGAGHPPTPYDPTIGGGLLHARRSLLRKPRT